MYKILCLVLMIAAAARSDNDDDLISQVFGPKTTIKTTQGPETTLKTTQSTTPVTGIKTNAPCKLSDGSMGKCLPYYQCDNQSVPTGGIDPVVSYEADECESYLDQCC